MSAWQDSGYYRQLFAAAGGGPTRTPTLSGLAVFGDADRFTAVPFTGTALEADAFLGLAPGTTRYAPPAPPGGAIACTGYLTGTSTGAVQAAQARLAAYAGLNGGELIVPTGVGWQGWDLWLGCWFTATDLAWSPAGIVAAPSLGAGWYQLGYAVIFRRAGRPGP